MTQDPVLAARRLAADVDSAQMTVNDVVVDLWRHRPFLTLVQRWLCSAQEPALAVGSVNVDHLHKFGRHRIPLPNDPETTGVHWIHLPDGAPVVVRASLLTGQSWPRLTGADLLPDILALAEEGSHRVGFLGGLPEVHHLLAKNLQERYPALDVGGFWSPERHTIDTPSASATLAQDVREAGVDLLVVGLGKPRQELWIQNWGAATGANVLLAFGASADFLAGKVRRAPEWVQACGMEWAYRLVREPRRLARRYLVEGPESLMLLRQAVPGGPNGENGGPPRLPTR